MSIGVVVVVVVAAAAAVVVIVVSNGYSTSSFNRLTLSHIRGRGFLIFQSF